MSEVLYWRLVIPSPDPCGSCESCAASGVLSPRFLRPPGQAGCYVYGSEIWRRMSDWRGEAAAGGVRVKDCDCPALRVASSGSEA